MTKAKPSQIDPDDPLRWVARGVPVEHTWRYGADAIGVPISSYTIVDRMISLLQDKDRFPNLNKVVVAGHSAGGQFAQRWALLSTKARSSSVRIVAANPKSFAYLDGRRLMFGRNFRLPTVQELNGCTTFNEWEWGFDNSTMMATAPYKDRAIESEGGVDALIQRYASVDVIYLSGEQDVVWNGHCEDSMQGINRLNRSAIFFQSIHKIYGRKVHRRWTIPDVHHDHCLMFQSHEGRLALFGLCDTEEIRPAIETERKLRGSI